MSFHSLGLSQQLLQTVFDQGYRQPTPVQRQAIPLILEGHDVLACAQTGTGKSASFLLPIIQLLTDATPAVRELAIIRALVLVPTRELAVQVHDSALTYGENFWLRAKAIYGGVGIKGQIADLRKGANLVVATPGRLLDHLAQKTIDLSSVDILVLDEADRMLDLGFLPDIRKIVAHLPKKRQNLMFSATFPEPIKVLAGQLLRDPVEISIAPVQDSAGQITEFVYGIHREYKPDLLSYLIGNGNWKQTLVFVRTQHGAERLEKQLIRNGIRAASLHGDKSQSARAKALEHFKSGTVNCLVATDLAARGLDIEQLPYVVNFDLPQKTEDYIHRIGRTGRAGFSGKAISLVCPEEAHLLHAIEALLKRKIPRVTDTGYEAVSLKAGSKPTQKASIRQKNCNNGDPPKRVKKNRHPASSGRFSAKKP